MRVAVVGTGIAGLTVAHELSGSHELTVFEAAARVGGHANTVDVTLGGRTFGVDTGFIVFNEPNYPGFTRLLTELDVATFPTRMSFSVSDGADLEYRASNPNSLFANRRNLLRPSYLRMLLEITRFNRELRELVADEEPWSGRDRLPDVGGPATPPSPSLAQFVAARGYSDNFVAGFLVPFGSAIWSAEPSRFLEFPARSYARFMSNHGLLSPRAAHRWRTVVGGSGNYVRALTAGFADRIHTAAPVRRVVTRPDGVVEVATERASGEFDAVVLATHSDQALNVLALPTPEQADILGAIRYVRNEVTLHTDASVMPLRRRAWASWNSRLVPGGERATLTYWMNQLQPLPTDQPLLVTLNSTAAINPASVLGEFEYQHPFFDSAALAAQQRRSVIQGQNGLYFAGAYFGYGFHEDGVQSGREVAAALRSRSVALERA